MDDSPGLFDLPEQNPSPIPLRSARGRARETFARTVVADVIVCDAAALRAHALKALERAIAIGDVVDDADADLLDPEEEIVTSSAAALQWCLEPTDGMWPLLESGAVRIDEITLSAEERGVGAVRASWTVTVKIRDAAAARELALEACPATDAAVRAEIDRSFAAAWHRAAEPCAPLAAIPGVTWKCADVSVEQVLARSR
jgi:hypothetical protein